MTSNGDAKRLRWISKGQTVRKYSLQVVGPVRDVPRWKSLRSHLSVLKVHRTVLMNVN